MATINFTETDSSASDNGVWCTGGTGGSGGIQNPASNGGTPGVGTVSPTVPSSATNFAATKINCAVASGVNWAAGTWTWRLNITVANMNLTVISAFICRNSGGVSVETLGSSTGLSISLGSTGVISGTISGSATTPTAGDSVVLVLLVSNGAMSSQQYSYLPNQNIDSPFTTAAGTNLLPFCIAPQGTR